LSYCIRMRDWWTLLQLGTAKVDITPRSPVPLAGFDIRTGVFDNVETPLFARIFCFRSEPAPPLVVISADLIWWGSERIEGMRHRVQAISGLEQSSVLLHATHNHSGPQTSERMSLLIGEASLGYIEMMEDNVVRGVREASGTGAPVSVERGSAACQIGIHRRRVMNGQVQMAPSPEGPNDRECTVLRFRMLSGATKAVLVHFTCHPTTTASNSVSGEFCGAATAEIERKLGNDVIASYLQGCCGDVRPALIENGEFYRGDGDDVRRLGHELADVASGVLAGDMETCAPAACVTAEATLPLGFDSAEAGTVAMEMTFVRLARNLAFLTFNAETVVEYGLYVKRLSGGSVLPLGYTNGMIGYVTTEQQLVEGGYESREAFRYFGMPGPFVPSTQKAVCRVVDALLQTPDD
jgi:hypothetical protein